MRYAEIDETTFSPDGMNLNIHVIDADIKPLYNANPYTSAAGASIQLEGVMFNGIDWDTFIPINYVYTLPYTLSKCKLQAESRSCNVHDAERARRITNPIPGFHADIRASPGRIRAGTA